MEEGPTQNTPKIFNPMITMTGTPQSQRMMLFMEGPFVDLMLARA